MSYYLEIPEPCSEDWNKMTPVNTNIRNCSSCQKNIVDFSSKTDLEIIDWIKQHPNQSICGRFLQNQVNRPLNEPSLAKQKKSFIRWIAVLTLLFNSSSLKGNRQLIHVEQVDRKTDSGTTPKPSNLMIGLIKYKKPSPKDNFHDVRVICQNTNDTIKVSASGRFEYLIPSGLLLSEIRFTFILSENTIPDQTLNDNNLDNTQVFELEKTKPVEFIMGIMPDRISGDLKELDNNFEELLMKVKWY